MADLALERNIKALKTLYPQGEGKAHHVRIESIQGLPAWIRGAVELYELPFLGMPSAQLYLVVPRTKMDFEHLVRIYSQLVEKLHAHVLVVADLLPPKHRPLLVKFRIPFIYKDESIFAPELGLKFSNLKTLQAEPRLELQNRNDALAPFAVKIAAGLLTNQIPEKFTLKLLYESLQEKRAKVSIAKLSNTLSDLAEKGMLLTQGGGPKKTYARSSIQATWQKLSELKLASLSREVQANCIPTDKTTYVIAGEMALAHYSNLAEPKHTTIAMSAGKFRNVYRHTKDTIAYGDFGISGTIQVWKGDPHLFSVRGLINPIELYLSMRHHADERIQMSLAEMLQPYGLTVKE